MTSIMSNYPTTIEEAVELLKSKLAKDTLDHIRNMTEDVLVIFHYGIGTTIRNQLGLSDGGNAVLLQDCACERADEASAVIVWELWKDLQEIGI